MNNLQSLPALRTERLADTVYALLREQILHGGFRPGDRLPVDALAQQFNISQTPIKSALTLLAADGLVVIHPRRGTFIAKVSDQQLLEMLAIRRALELLATETIFDHVTEDDLAALRQLAAAIEEATDVDDHYRGNFEFHLKLIAISGNRMLVDFYRQLNSHIHMALVHSGSSTWRSRAHAESEEHQAMIDALAAHDEGELRTTIVAHLQRAAASLLADLHDQQEPEDYHDADQQD